MFATLVLALGAAAVPQVDYAPLVSIPKGSYQPLIVNDGEPSESPVAGFLLEARPVSNADFKRFVRANPKWRRSKVIRLFADEHYLSHWQADLPRSVGARTPVVYVSYFAAKAYCSWRGRRLPTTAEWEYVGAASETAARGRDDAKYNQKILNWYAKPNTGVLPQLKDQKPNFYGVYDMHGVVWEWTADFNSTFVTGESRGDSAIERKLYCAAGAVGTADPSDYAAFMRAAFRSSLKGPYTGVGLGFRCAADERNKR